MCLYSLIYFRWTISSWAPLTPFCCLWLQAPLKVLQWTQVLLCRSTLLKCPAVLCSQTSLRWKQWTYGFTFSPKCSRHICTSSFDYRSLIINFTLCLTASDGHGTPLYCHHWGKALDETAYILWLWSDRRRCVAGIPLVCSMGNLLHYALLSIWFCVSEVEKLDENLYEKASEDAGTPKRYYFENLKISVPQVKLSVFTSHKLPPDLKVQKPQCN